MLDRTLEAMQARFNNIGNLENKDLLRHREVAEKLGKDNAMSSHYHYQLLCEKEINKRGVKYD